MVHAEPGWAKRIVWRPAGRRATAGGLSAAGQRDVGSEGAVLDGQTCLAEPSVEPGVEAGERFEVAFETDPQHARRAVRAEAARAAQAQRGGLRCARGRFAYPLQDLHLGFRLLAQKR